MKEPTPPTIGVVCHGNILRSQVLAAYLRTGIAAHHFPWLIYDAGVCADPAVAFRNAQRLLTEVEQQLRTRGLGVRLQQTTWSPQVATALGACALILAADEQVRQTLQQRLPAPHPPIYGFYDLLGEGDQSFPDTYDYQRHQQRPDTFARSFDELQRIATRLLEVLPGHFAQQAAIGRTADPPDCSGV